MGQIVCQPAQQPTADGTALNCVSEVERTDSAGPFGVEDADQAERGRCSRHTTACCNCFAKHSWHDIVLPPPRSSSVIQHGTRKSGGNSFQPKIWNLCNLDKHPGRTVGLLLKNQRLHWERVPGKVFIDGMLSRLTILPDDGDGIGRFIDVDEIEVVGPVCCFMSVFADVCTVLNCYETEQALVIQHLSGEERKTICIIEQSVPHMENFRAALQDLVNSNVDMDRPGLKLQHSMVPARFQRFQYDSESVD